MTTEEIATQAPMVLEETPETAVIVRGSVRVEFSTTGDVTLYSTGNVMLVAAVDNSADAKPKMIGDRMPDGTVYAGVSPDTGRRMYVFAADAPLTMKWKAAMVYAADINANGHWGQDWKIPTKAELGVLYENRDKGALKGTFDTSGSNRSGWYWSATLGGTGLGYVWMERFSDGNQHPSWREDYASVRAVRLGPRP